MNKICKYGTHRVISPHNVLPQNAVKVDNSLPCLSSEILVEVDTLNVDSASFIQMMDVAKGDLEEVKINIHNIVKEKGKLQNPVTGSGGMLLGTVKEIGPDHPNKNGLEVGDRIASLVSLTLTPLKIERIAKIHPQKSQVKIKGHAVFFESGVLAKVPENIPEALALAILDVAGAPAQVQRLAKPDHTVVIIGAGGKSGMLSLAAAREKLGNTGKIIAIEPSKNGQERLKKLDLTDTILGIDACDPIECMNAVSLETNAKMADLVVNCAPVENTEMSSIMSARNGGTVYFFSMATSFTKAALGAEGIGSDTLLIIGNGYVPDNDKISIEMVRKYPKIRKILEEIYLPES